MTRSPAQDTINWLATLVDDPKHGGQAQSALGAAAYNSRSAAHRGWNALPTLMNQLAKDQSVGRLKQTLIALGTAGSPASLPQVEPYLAHDVSGVRAAAVTALRRIPGGRVDELLAHALGNDPSTTVRNTVLTVFQERGYSAVLGIAAESAARTDKVAQVRYNAVKLLLRWAKEFPAASDAVSWVAANDTNSKVRRLAQDGLEQLRRKG
jgi:hypothetical protein